MTTATRDRKIASALSAGFILGPFLVSLSFVLVLRWLGWPQLNVLLIHGSTCVGVGMVCFLLWLRPKGLQWLYLLPYGISYFIAVTLFSVAMGFILGAPK